MKRKITYGLMALLLTFTVNAQKLKVVSGKFDFLKDQKEINVIFDYSGVTFYKEKMTENEYIQKRSEQVSEKNTGENWADTWQEYKDTKFPDKFFASANKYISSNTLTFKSNTKSKYTLIVKTDWIKPGSAMAVAKVSTTLKFVNTDNPSEELLVITCKEAPGKSFAIHRNILISEGYAMTGKELAQLLNKKIK